MASKYVQKYNIPPDFPEILHDFVRELLRDQPADIYDYGAQYFKAMDEAQQAGEEEPKFDYNGKGRNIPPDRDSRPSLGNIHQMTEGTLPEEEQEQRNEILSRKDGVYKPPSGDMTSEIKEPRLAAVVQEAIS